MVLNLRQKNSNIFARQGGIQHTFTAPYHSGSNGEAERLVETFKLGINKADPKTASELGNAVIEFLAKYRAIPHTVTNTSLSEMLNNRRLKTTLDLLHPCQADSTTLRVRQRANHVTHTKAR